MTDYDQLDLMLRGLFEGVPYEVSNLSNAAALIWENLCDINWAGFYLLRDGHLVLGPFQGRVACTTIEVGKGVCGTAVAGDCTQVVPDVHAFPGHIACDSASNSEIVIPIHRNGGIFGVLDIDSPRFSRFDDNDRQGLEKLVRTLELSLCSWR